MELEVGKKRLGRYKDERGKEWLIEFLLRDPAEELSQKKEEEFNQNERKNKRTK